jgi:hypothetical protein
VYLVDMWVLFTHRGSLCFAVVAVDPRGLRVDGWLAELGDGRVLAIDCHVARPSFLVMTREGACVTYLRSGEL